MQQYLVIEKISVQNANAIAGLTYGFPGITNFLGFAHALSRKIKASQQVTLGGVAVVSHSNTVHARQPKGWGDYVFALTRNPLTKEGKTAPINEEGRLTMELSLLIEIEGLIAGDEQHKQALLEELSQQIPRLRLAGGQIIGFKKLEVIQSEQQEIKALRRLMPGFVLMDRSEYLSEHFTQLKLQDDSVSLFDAWCDFSKIKYQAHKLVPEENSDRQGEAQKTEQAEWRYVPKPCQGYLVPITVGYCAISPVYKPGEVNNVRDNDVPVVFAEAAYSVGEWLSTHRLSAIADAVWRYEHQHPWYLAKSKPFQDEVLDIEALNDEIMTF